MKVTLAIVASLLLGGCASFEVQPVTETRGNGLVTVVAQTPDVMNMICQRDNVLGCVPYRNDVIGVTIWFRIPQNMDQPTLNKLVAVSAHEFCHAVHQIIKRTYLKLEPFLSDKNYPPLRALVERYENDPCHIEDGGKYHPR